MAIGLVMKSAHLALIDFDINFKSSEWNERQCSVYTLQSHSFCLPPIFLRHTDMLFVNFVLCEWQLHTYCPCPSRQSDRLFRLVSGSIFSWTKLIGQCHFSSWPLTSATRRLTLISVSKLYFTVAWLMVLFWRCFVDVTANLFQSPPITEPICKLHPPYNHPQTVTRTRTRNKDVIIHSFGTRFEKRRLPARALVFLSCCLVFLF